jgi:hypothetical protein
MYLKKSPIRLLSFIIMVVVLAACSSLLGGVADPSSFTAAPGVTTVSLSWTTVEDATGYTLERKEGAGTFTSVVSNQKKLTHTDTGLKPNTSYTYRLRAVKGSAQSTGKTKGVTTVAQGNPINITAFTPVWLSKQPVNFPLGQNPNGGEVRAVKAAANNAVPSSNTITINGTGEAMYYLGGLCTSVNTSPSGEGVFRIVADDKEIVGSAGSFDLVGKQFVSFVHEGAGTGVWNDITLYCDGTPNAVSADSAYLKGKWGDVFPWGDGVSRGTPGTDPRQPGYYPNGEIVPTHVANLPDGRIVSFSSWREYTYGNKDGENPPFIDQTAGYIWNPGQNATQNTASTNFTPTETLGHDMFCAGLSVLSNGQIFTAGGGSTLTGGRVAPSQLKTSYFDFRSNAWSAGSDGDLKSDHWYGTAVALPDNRLFVLGGSGSSAKITTSAEIRGPNASDQWVNSTSSLAGAFPRPEDVNLPGNVVLSPGSDLANAVEFGEVWGWYPYLNVDPNGDLFLSGPGPSLRRLNVNGSNVSAANAGEAPSTASQMRTWGNSILFDEGKILVTGGAVVRGAGATNSGFVIDMSGGGVASTATTFMRFRRGNHNTVVLPTGDVLAIGGNNSAKQFTDGLPVDSDGYLDNKDSEPNNANNRWESDILTETVFTPELYSPDKNTWRDLTDMKEPRNYHSVGILLKDGRVLAAGGGLCGDFNFQTNQLPACNHPNGEIFEPPYLFNEKNELANRPAIGSLGAGASSNPDASGTYDVTAGSVFNVTMNGLGDGSNISKFSMIKLSAVTHSINTDVRYIEYSTDKGNLSGSGTSYQLTLTSNKNVLTPGYYFLFALNDKGVPSEAVVVQVN